MEGLSRSKSGKGLKNIKKYRHVCLRTPDLPAFAELQNSQPFRSYLALKFGFFEFCKKVGGALTSIFGKAGELGKKLIFLKGLLHTQPPKSKRNFLSGFYWLRYD
jgi:hypothetical protein